MPPRSSGWRPTTPALPSSAGAPPVPPSTQPVPKNWLVERFSDPFALEAGLEQYTRAGWEVYSLAAFDRGNIILTQVVFRLGRV